MAASAIMSAASALPACHLQSTSFLKDSTCSRSGDMLEACRQPCFVGSPRSMTRLRRVAVPRQESRPLSATMNLSLAMPFPGKFMADVQQDDVKDTNEEGNIVSSSSMVVEMFNVVMADVVDGQNYMKEAGRTKARPMKRRWLVVCMAMGAMQSYASEVESRMGNLRRTTSASLATTCRLVSQLSYGASRAVSYIADGHRTLEAE